VIAQRERHLTQFLVEQRVDFLARRRIRRQRPDDSGARERGEQRGEEPAADRRHQWSPVASR
jgi:hypothetical protein